MPTKIELDAAYSTTTYRVFLPGGAVDLRIDAGQPAFAAWLKENGVSSWALLTAFNPCSELRPPAENAERQAALEVALLEKGFEPFAGENIADGGAWPAEDTCFVPAIGLGEAAALARRFGQNAIVFGEADGFPRLVWIEYEE